MSITPANTETTSTAESKSAIFPTAVEPFGLTDLDEESLCAGLREEVPDAGAERLLDAVLALSAALARDIEAFFPTGLPLPPSFLCIISTQRPL